MIETLTKFKEKYNNLVKTPSKYPSEGIGYRKIKIHDSKMEPINIRRDLFFDQMHIKLSKYEKSMKKKRIKKINK